MRRDQIGLAMASMLALAACDAPRIDPGSLPVTDHFDGHRFFNPDGQQGSGGQQRQTPVEMLEQAMRGRSRGPSTWPDHVPVTPSRPAASIAGEAMRVTWIGHASVLVQTEGLNILIDPVWAERASPVSFAGPKRVREPGIRFRDLPKIDLVLISHDHYDHMDTAILQRLWRRDRPLIVTGLNNDRLLARYDVPAVARDWGQRVTVRPGIAVILNRAHHWSAHGPHDHNRTLWTGFTVTLPGGNLYYAGDTGPGDMRWATEAARLGPVRLAILPIGAWHFNGAESGNHIGPADAVAAFGQVGAAYALGVHWGTFELTSEGIDQPRDGLRKALADAHVAAVRFRTLEAGGSWDVPAMRDARQG